MTTCKICEDVLVHRLDEEVQGEDLTVPDDLQLSCGCHFHWQCLLDESETVAVSLKCPSCNASIVSNQPGASATNAFIHTSGSVVLANYTSEGGFEEGMDLMPSITEEAYLAANPDARPARAFHVMCTEGDSEGIVMMLSSLDESQEEIISLLCYQDPLAGNKTGLHRAVENGQEEVALLLAWLCSTAPSEAFPDDARNMAEASGIPRLAAAPEQDVRSLKDASGATAGQAAVNKLSPPIAKLLLS